MLEFDDYRCGDCGYQVEFPGENRPLETVHYESTNRSPLYSTQAVTLCLDDHKTHHPRPPFVHSGVLWFQGTVVSEVSWGNRHRVNVAGYIQLHIHVERVLEHRFIYMQVIDEAHRAGLHITSIGTDTLITRSNVGRVHHVLEGTSRQRDALADMLN